MNNNSWVDYYEILGVKIEDEIKTIKKEYHKLSRKYHPDAHPDATEEEKKEYEEKIKLINEAASILTDEEKRREYDSTYESYKNDSFQDNDYDNQDFNNATYEDVTYEDVKNNYTKEEQYYAKVQSLKQIIEEELEKTNIILDEKNRLIMDAYYELIIPEDYYNSLKELLIASQDFIESLYELIEKAKEYGMFGEVQAIEDTISFIKNVLDEIPENVFEAEFSVKKDVYKESSIKKLEELKVDVDNSIDKINSILVYTNGKMISKKEYYDIYVNCINEAKDLKSEINELMKIFGILNLEEELDIATDLSSKLSVKMEYIPSDYDKAVKLGEKINNDNKIKKALNKNSEIEKEANRIANILAKHKSSRRYKQLYEYCESLYQKSIDLLEDIKEEVSQSETIDDKKISFVNYINEAIKVYKEANEVHEQADLIYSNLEEEKINIGKDEKIILSLSKNAYSAIDKISALESFVDAKEVIDILKKIEEEISKDESSLYKKLQSNIYSMKNKRDSFVAKFKNIVEIYDNYTQTNSKVYKATKGKYSKDQILKAFYREIIKTKRRMRIELSMIIGCLTGTAFGLGNIASNIVFQQALTNLPISIIIAIVCSIGAITFCNLKKVEKNYFESLLIDLNNVNQLKDFSCQSCVI